MICLNARVCTLRTTKIAYGNPKTDGIPVYFGSDVESERSSESTEERTIAKICLEALAFISKTRSQEVEDHSFCRAL